MTTVKWNKMAFYFCMSVCLLSCKKNDHDTGFTAAPRIFFSSYQSADSLYYSFANYPVAPAKDLFVTVRVMGEVANYDRLVEVEVVANETSALASEYEVGSPILVPAGSVTGVVPVTVRVTPRLESEEAVLGIRLKPSKDFLVEPEKVDKMDELVKFRIIWTNILARPDDWPAIVWGGYSQTKHRLVVELTGVSEFSGEEWSSTGMAYKIMGVCNQWLTTYQLEHNGQAYVDENNQSIRFCPTCK